MKKIVLITLFVMITSSAFAAGLLPRDGKGMQIQGCAFNGTLTQILSISSTIKDMTDYLCYQIMSPVQCKMRTMPTSTKTNYVTTTIFDNTPTTILTSRATPFANFSGCAGAELQVQLEPQP